MNEMCAVADCSHVKTVLVTATIDEGSTRLEMGLCRTHAAPLLGQLHVSLRPAKDEEKG